MSFGEELRRERELREISLRDISEATKISVRYLQALESNDFTELPGGVFNRGFVRAYAQFIGIDPDGSVDAYIHEETQQAEGEEGLEETGGVLRGGGRRVRAAGGKASDPTAAKTWVWFAAIVIVLAAVGMVGWYYFAPKSGDTPAGAKPAESESSAPRTPPTSAAGSGPTGTESSSTVPLPSSRHSGGAVVARILIDSATQGRINCDDRQTERLADILPGTRLELACSDFIAIEAADGGAIRVGLGGETPRALGAVGERVEGYRVSVPDWLRTNHGGSS